MAATENPPDLEEFQIRRLMLTGKLRRRPISLAVRDVPLQDRTQQKR